MVHLGPEGGPHPGPAPDEIVVDAQTVEGARDDGVEQLLHRGGLGVEGGGGRHDDRPGFHQRRHVAQVDERERGLAEHQHQRLALLEHDVRGAAHQVERDTVRDPRHTPGRAGDHQHRVVAGGARREGGGHVARRPRPQAEAGGVRLDLVRPHQAAGLGEDHVGLDAGGAARTRQEPEHALGVGRARGPGDPDDELHAAAFRAITMEATGGKSSRPEVTAKPLPRHIASKPGRSVHAPIDAARYW